MSEGKSDLEVAVRDEFAPPLRAQGFAGSALQFSRSYQGVVQVVQVQSAKAGAAFAVNLAFHPLTIPDIRGRVPDANTIDASDCEFRRRLAEGESDQWWSYESSKTSVYAAHLRALNWDLLKMPRPFAGSCEYSPANETDQGGAEDPGYSS